MSLNVQVYAFFLLTTFVRLFDSISHSDDQTEYECIVLPPTKEGGPLGLLLDYNDHNLQTQYFSHEVETLGGSGMRYNARLMVKIRETEKLIDPLDFRYHKGKVFNLA